MITRREVLVAATGAYGARLLHAQEGSITAAQVIERIQKNVGVPWRTETVDKIKAGAPDTPVKGIATSMVASFDLLKRASSAGRNLIIVHEPTFYTHLDQTSEVEGDPVYQAKREFIEKNNMVVFRFHDHWHARRPDGIRTGMIASLGWEKYRNPDHPRQYAIPEASLASVAASIQKQLKMSAIRVVGDPALTVRKVVLNPGSTNLRQILRNVPDADLYVYGETTEWQSIEYARDVLSMGRKFGVIALGHVVSEENGMEECARWLKTFVPEVPIEFMPAGEPFWSPNSKT